MSETQSDSEPYFRFSREDFEDLMSACVDGDERDGSSESEGEIDLEIGPDVEKAYELEFVVSPVGDDELDVGDDEKKSEMLLDQEEMLMKLDKINRLDELLNLEMLRLERTYTSSSHNPPCS